MEPFACGELALTPSEFYALTPREFYLMWDGWKVRTSNFEEHSAWMVATLVNYISERLSQAVTIESILGRPLRANLDEGLAKKDRLRRQHAEGK